MLHGPQHDLDAGVACNRPNDASKSNWAVHPSLAFVTRRKVQHFDNTTVFRFKARDQNRGIANIFLAGRDLSFQLKPPDTRFAIVAIKQSAKNRVPVNTRYAAPNQASAIVDQAANLAIADRPEFQIGQIAVLISFHVTHRPNH